MIKIDGTLTPKSLLPKIRRLWRVSAGKIRALEKTCPPGAAAPVFTLKGKYTARGWTEWTRGFQYGSALLQFDATGVKSFLELGRRRTRQTLGHYLTHFGVHDHGFNIVSTYGNLWRLRREGRLDCNRYELEMYELALKVSGAVQAKRWTSLPKGGYIYSFNGPHSLFIDTIRSLRSLALAYHLGQDLEEEGEVKISLLERLLEHAGATARYAIGCGKGRDRYDVRGRVTHESIFNLKDGSYRCPSSQQGFSPFTTWTRGLAWAMLGYAEQLEFLAGRRDRELRPYGGRAKIEALMLGAARATCDFYLAHTPSDGIPYWDTGAPGLRELGDYLDRPADPFNDYEPVDSSAATIAAQGLLRLGRYLRRKSRSPKAGKKYWQAGLTVLDTLLSEPYLCLDTRHQGLILHSVYHRPKGWDHVPRGRKAPCGEASMWGDYHAREVALYVQRLARNEPYYTFFGC